MDPDLTAMLPTASAGGLLALVVLLILTGRLVPRSALDASERRAAEWRRIADTNAATVGELAGNVGRLADVSQRLLDAHQLPQQAHRAVTGRHRWPVA